MNEQLIRLEMRIAALEARLAALEERLTWPWPLPVPRGPLNPICPPVVREVPAYPFHSPTVGDPVYGAPIVTCSDGTA